MNKEQEQLMEMVETIIDTILDLKSKGMSDFMIKEMMIGMMEIIMKEEEVENDGKGMLN
jgi:hypothetical protein